MPAQSSTSTSCNERRAANSNDAKGMPVIGCRLATNPACAPRLSSAIETHSIGTPLCQDAAGTAVLDCCLAGPGSGLFQEPMSGVRSVTPD